MTNTEKLIRGYLYHPKVKLSDSWGENLTCMIEFGLCVKPEPGYVVNPDHEIGMQFQSLIDIYGVRQNWSEIHITDYSGLDLYPDVFSEIKRYEEEEGKIKYHTQLEKILKKCDFINVTPPEWYEEEKRAKEKEKEKSQKKGWFW